MFWGWSFYMRNLIDSGLAEPRKFLKWQKNFFIAPQQPKPVF